MTFFGKICRLCITNKNVRLNFETLDADDITLGEKLKFILPEFINQQNDVLPQGICDVCYKVMKNSYKFKKICEKTHKHLMMCLELLKKKQEYERIVSEKIDKIIHSNRLGNEVLLSAVEIKTEFPLDCNIENPGNSMENVFEQVAIVNRNENCENSNERENFNEEQHLSQQSDDRNCKNLQKENDESLSQQTGDKDTTCEINLLQPDKNNLVKSKMRLTRSKSCLSVSPTLDSVDKVRKIDDGLRSKELQILCKHTENCPQQNMTETLDCKIENPGNSMENVFEQVAIVNRNENCENSNERENFNKEQHLSQQSDDRNCKNLQKENDKSLSQQTGDKDTTCEINLLQPDKNNLVKCNMRLTRSKSCLSLSHTLDSEDKVRKIDGSRSKSTSQDSNFHTEITNNESDVRRKRDTTCEINLLQPDKNNLVKCNMRLTRSKSCLSLSHTLDSEDKVRKIDGSRSKSTSQDSNFHTEITNNESDVRRKRDTTCEINLLQPDKNNLVKCNMRLTRSKSCLSLSHTLDSEDKVRKIDGSRSKSTSQDSNFHTEITNNESDVRRKRGRPRSQYVKAGNSNMIDSDSDSDSENYQTGLKYRPKRTRNIINYAESDTSGILTRSKSTSHDSNFHPKITNNESDFRPKRARPRSRSKSTSHDSNFHPKITNNESDFRPKRGRPRSRSKSTSHDSNFYTKITNNESDVRRKRGRPRSQYVKAKKN